MIAQIGAEDDPAVWIEAIRDEQARPPKTVTAEIFLDRWETSSRPVLLACDDGRDYVVKGANAGRKAVNDQVVGRLGRGIGAPVPRVVLVHVPFELVRDEPQMGHVIPGIAHGSALLREVHESYLVEYRTEAENRIRYARLAVLWGWVGAFDRQYLYDDAPPHLVHAFDHSHVFPGGPDWTRVTLQRARPAQLDPEIMETCRLVAADLATARPALEGMNSARIARAVAAPPSEWGLEMSERVALATFLARRRVELLRLMAGIT